MDHSGYEPLDFEQLTLAVHGVLLDIAQNVVDAFHEPESIAYIRQLLDENITDRYWDDLDDREMTKPRMKKSRRR